MNTRSEGRQMRGRFLRWTARVWSVVSIGLLLAFIVGEGLNPSGAHEWIGLLFFPIGISLGMLWAWRNERVGGTMTVVSLLLFYVVHLTTSGTFPAGFAWLAFAAPGFLFLLASRLSGVSRSSA